MNAKKLYISLALTLGLLALAGALALMGTWACPEIALAQGPDGHATYYVAPNCTGLPAPCHTTVQAAVAAVDDPDDVIKVAEGTYNVINTYGGLAQVVYISKSLTLRGGYNADFTAWDPEAYTTTLDAQDNGRVLYISGDISPTVEGFRITGGNATGLGGGWWGGDGGGGIYVITATATISRNTITNNVAGSSDEEDGSGGGIYLYHSDAYILDNTITGNQAATDSWVSGWGGGLCAEGGAPTLRHNQVLDNQAGAGGGWFGSGDGGGLYFVESQPTLEANQIRENRAVGSGDWGTGGGVEIAACPDFTLINNVIADNVAPYGGAGLWIGRMSGVPSSGRLLHTTIASNEGGAYDVEGVRISQGGVVTMVNTILVNHDIGIAVEQTTTVVMTATLWGSGAWANVTDTVAPTSATVISSTNLWGDPAFLNPDGGDYHIAVTSPAVDEGVDAGVTTDIDGEPRDASPDIGADEVGGWGLQVVKAASATDLYPGDTVTYTVAVTGAGTFSVTNVVLTDTLPALQRPLNASPGCSIADPGYGGLVICDVGDLNAGQAAHITITAQVTTTLPATLPQTMGNIALAAGDQAQNDGYADTILHEPLDCHARVNGAGPEYTTVQAAVDAASAGDTVWIAGTCLGAFERAGLDQQVYLTKSLTLRGGYSPDFSAWNPDLYTTTLDAGGQGRVVYVTGPVNVTIEALRLTGGDATDLGGIPDGFVDAGGGLYAIGATVVLSDSRVTGNVASTSFGGFGGGVGVTTATLTLVETTLSNNIASSAGLGMGYGGGLSAEFSTVRLERSRLEENIAAVSLTGFGGGAYFYESDLEASATLWLSNTVSADLDWGEGGGLYVAGTQPFTLTNCVLAENRADDGFGSGGSGLWIDGAPGVLLHPTIARNWGAEGVGTAYTATVAITNAIIAGHEVGIRAMEGSTVTVNGVLWHDNISDTDTVAGTILVSNGVTGTLAFVPDGYHITPASQARDNGVVSSVADDVDGDPRPSGSGYDLGADEYVCVTGVEIDGPAGGFAGFPYTFIATASPVAATPPITYTWEAMGQTPRVHTGGLSDTAVFTWVVTGPQVITVTAVNECGGGVSKTHTITVEAEACTALDGVIIAGPPTATVGSAATFTATVTPPDAAQPVTYTWEAEVGQVANLSYVTHTGGLSDTAVFTWAVTGPQVITVTAVNECGGGVSKTHTITVEAEACTALDGVIIAGPPTATVGSAATFTATVTPPDAAQPVTYTWEAEVGQVANLSYVTHTGGLSDTAVFTWVVTGPQVVTVTAVNECGGGVSKTHTITVEAEACTALDGVIIAGPPTATVGIAATFTAIVTPPDAAQPVTYTWEAEVGQVANLSYVTHTGGLSDTAVFTWVVTGPQVVTVTAVNECGGGVSKTHAITVAAEAPQWYIYLPLVVRSYGEGGSRGEGYLYGNLNTARGRVPFW